MNLKTKLTMLKGVITKKSPIYVQFALSKYCNLRCSMCQAVEARKNERELNLDEIKKLASVLNRLGAGIIVLTGGEPLLRKDLPEIVKIFTEKGLEVRLQTNGLLATEEKIKAFLDAGLKEVTLSLDTLDPEKQDRINNQAGSWDKTIKALALFSDLLPKRGNMTGVNTVVSKLNIDEIPRIVKFVTAIGFYSSLIPVHLSSNNTGDFIVRADASQFKFSESDFGLINNIYAEIILMKKAGFHIHNSFRFLSESPNFLQYGKVNWTCDSPYLYFSISPGGYFLPCVDLKGTKSMLDDDFIEVFYSKSFQEDIRKTVKDCPGCFYACYPEITYFCRDFKTTVERFWQAYQISRTLRRPISYDGCIRLIEKIRYEDYSNPA